MFALKRTFVSAYFIIVTFFFIFPIDRTFAWSPESAIGEIIKDLEESMSKLINSIGERTDSSIILFRDALQGQIYMLKTAYKDSLDTTFSNISIEKQDAFNKIQFTIDKVSVDLKSNIEIVDRDFRLFAAILTPLLKGDEPVIIALSPSKIPPSTSGKTVVLKIFGANLANHKTRMVISGKSIAPAHQSENELHFIVYRDDLPEASASSNYQPFELIMSIPRLAGIFSTERKYPSYFHLLPSTIGEIYISARVSKQRPFRKQITSPKRSVSSVQHSDTVKTCLRPESGWLIDVHSIRKKFKSDAWIKKPGRCCNGSRAILDKDLLPERVCMTLVSRPLDRRARAVIEGYLVGYQVKSEPFLTTQEVELKNNILHWKKAISIPLPENTVSVEAILITENGERFVLTPSSGSHPWAQVVHDPKLNRVIILPRSLN